MSESAAKNEQALAVETRNNLQEPFVAATHAALTEMAGVEPMVRAAGHGPGHQEAGGLSTVLKLGFVPEGYIVLRFPMQTAAALSSRILAGITGAMDEQLIRDCVAEIGNVIAGQAKALLAGTPYHFTFSLPSVLPGVQEFQPPPGLYTVAIGFDSDLGRFDLKLHVPFVEGTPGSQETGEPGRVHGPTKSVP
jgi:chemotaxis protein CheX